MQKGCHALVTQAKMILDSILGETKYSGTLALFMLDLVGRFQSRSGPMHLPSNTQACIARRMISIVTIY